MMETTLRRRSEVCLQRLSAQASASSSPSFLAAAFDLDDGGVPTPSVADPVANYSLYHVPLCIPAQKLSEIDPRYQPYQENRGGK